MSEFRWIIAQQHRMKVCSARVGRSHDVLCCATDPIRSGGGTEAESQPQQYVPRTSRRRNSCGRLRPMWTSRSSIVRTTSSSASRLARLTRLTMSRFRATRTERSTPARVRRPAPNRNQRYLGNGRTHCGSCFSPYSSSKRHISAFISSATGGKLSHWPRRSITSAPCCNKRLLFHRTFGRRIHRGQCRR